MTVNRWIQLVCVLITAACVLGAAMLTPDIDKQRKELQLTFVLDDGKAMPPKEALATMALGSFRGLLADVLWYRATQLQQAGRLHEADQLARWITTLQPRFGQVWVFQGWNMAYNISVKTHTPEERWEWVNKGIRLVRDKGIPYNETNVLLYKELAWWFFHKIGQYSDDMHWYYKIKFAEEWHIVLGDAAEGADTEEVLAAFETIVNAPDTVGQLAAEDEGVRELLAQLAELGWRQNHRGRFERVDGPAIVRDEREGKLLRNLGYILMILGARNADLVGREELLSHLELRGIDARLIGVVENETLRPALDRLLATLRKRELEDYYNMDPRFMFKVMQGRAGEGDEPVPLPIDWRHPSAHAIYWSQLGTEKSIYLLNKKNVDELNTYRQYIHAVQHLVYSGRILFDPLAPRGDGKFGRVDMYPDVRYFNAYDQAVEAGREYVMLHSEMFNDPTVDSFDTGHENLLIKAVVFSHMYGYREQAQRFYDKVRRLYSHKPENQRTGRYRMPLERFVDVEAPMAWEEYVGRVQAVDAFLRSAFVQGLAEGDLEAYGRFRRYAAMAYEKFNQTGNTITTAPQDRLSLGMGETQAQSFQEKEIATFALFMQSSMENILLRRSAWRHAPLHLRQGVYDRILPALSAQAQQFRLPVERVIPEPEGMEEYRERRPVVPALQQRGGRPPIERQ